MADTKITALTALTAADPANDVIPIVDVSDTTMAASGTTKKISVNNILGASGTATLASATITGAVTVGTTLGVTGVSTFAAGTALLPALTTTGDTNTGIYYPAADTFAVTTGGTERYRVDSSGNVLVGTVTSPGGTKVGAIAKLSTVSVEGTAAINVSTTPVAIGKTLGTGGLFFVTGYNIIGGAQCWFLVASTGGGTPTVIANSNLTGLTVAFTTVSGVVYMNTTSGTIQVNSFAVTN